MFKVIDGQLTTVFNKVEKINTGFGNTKDEIENIIKNFNEYNQTQNKGALDNFYKDIASKNQNVANMFQDLAKQGASAKASVEGVYAAILDGNTTGYGNVKSVIGTFNSITDFSHQQAFAKAVGQTNKNLGEYLSNIKDSSASMKRYGSELVANTAKTIGLKVATVALNAAINLGISALIGLAVTGVTNFINKQKEMEQAQEEAIEKSKELVSNLKKENSTLEEAIQKYSEFSSKTTLA